LAAQGLLAEEEIDSPLLGLVFLHEDLTVLAGPGDSFLENSLLLQKAIESLMKMRSPLG
jgi:hypothetical protein